MAKHLRKIIIRFESAEHLKQLSDKIFGNSDFRLLKNHKSIEISDNNTKTTLRRVVRQRPKVIKEWQRHWHNLTPFVAEKKISYAKIEFLFGKEFDNKKLSELLEQSITIKSKSISFPIKQSDQENLLRCFGTRGNPQYPIYIISKGRSDNCITADHLIKMGVDFKIVVEKSEIDAYSKHYGVDTLIELDTSFRDNYDTYIENFDESKSKGSGPARNFVWWHAKNVVKSKWHWIMDDNIYGFNYYMDKKRIKAVDGTIFAGAEDFVNRYNNIGISGLNYYMFAVPGSKDRPYVSNTKVYSCLLINNNISVRWAGRYNEDVDLCIRALKEGYSTIQFDAFLSKKGGTQLMGGGNTDAFYAEEGTLPKSNMLANNHPDITHVQWRFQRWHHMTCYDIFDFYKDRTILDCIKNMTKEPIISSDNIELINRINAIELKTNTDWNIFEDIEQNVAEEIIKVLKFYRYSGDTQRCVNILTAQKLLNCDYIDYVWGNDLSDSPDNTLMLKLIELGDERGILSYEPDWDSLFEGVDSTIGAAIKKELLRNKYIFKEKEYEKFDYNIKVLKISEDDHKNHNDSKARIINDFTDYTETNESLIEPVTYYDKRMRGEIVVSKAKKSFVSNLTARYEQVTKTHDSYTVMIHGSADYINKEKFALEIHKLIPDNVEEIINSVYYPVDYWSANYALKNKIKNKEFVPDELSHGAAMYKKIYSEMIQYCDECILFINSSTPDLEYIISELNKMNKKITVIKDSTQTESLDDWE